MRVKTLIKLLQRLDPETIVSREISEIDVTNTFLEGHAEEIALPLDCPYKTLPELLENASPEEVTRYLKKSVLTFYACDTNKVTFHSFSAKHFVNYYDPDMNNVVCDEDHKRMIKEDLFRDYIPRIRHCLAKNNFKELEQLKQESPFFMKYYDEMRKLAEV